jgi:hypothetical protein
MEDDLDANRVATMIALMLCAHCPRISDTDRDAALDEVRPHLVATAAILKKFSISVPKDGRYSEELGLRRAATYGSLAFELGRLYGV